MPQAAPPPKPPQGSLTLRSAAALAVAYVAARFGAQLPEGAAQEIAGALIDLVFALGVLGVGVGRARARGPIV
jgi:hypothetical protein